MKRSILFKWVLFVGAGCMSLLASNYVWSAEEIPFQIKEEPLVPYLLPVYIGQFCQILPTADYFYLIVRSYSNPITQCVDTYIRLAVQDSFADYCQVSDTIMCADEIHDGCGLIGEMPLRAYWTRRADREEHRASPGGRALQWVSLCVAPGKTLYIQPSYAAFLCSQSLSKLSSSGMFSIVDAVKVIQDTYKLSDDHMVHALCALLCCRIGGSCYVPLDQGVLAPHFVLTPDAMSKLAETLLVPSETVKQLKFEELSGQQQANMERIKALFIARFGKKLSCSASFESSSTDEEEAFSEDDSVSASSGSVDSSAESKSGE